MTTLPSPFANWFTARGWTPRPHQLALLEAAAANESVLLIAPTGGGKTLAGFLPSLMELAADPTPRLHTLYVSPLKALATDIARNLAAPVREMNLPVAIETRTGDTPANRRVRQREHPPHILLTTPESLAVLLSMPEPARMFGGLRRLVLDEVHAIAGTKRGDQLALCAERLVTIAPGLHRVGLSATVAHRGAIQAFVGATHRIEVADGAAPELTMQLPAGPLAWSGHMALEAAPEVMARIRAANMTIVFVNTRGQAELMMPPGVFDPSHYQLAISYGRFSSPQQATGQSRERQTAALNETLERHGWRLLDEYFDHGVSAARGKHRAVGALGRLLRRVKAREIPTPVVLIVETFDRLSREELTTAQEQFLSLINQGMAIYTTMDQQGYDKRSLNANPGALFTSIGMMLGANGVYKVMSNRAEKGWAKRREQKTAVCPSWLRLKPDGSDYEVIEGCQEILERIFSEAQYMGLDKVAARLNDSGVPPFESWAYPHRTARRLWYDSQLRRIITGRTVRGETEVGKYVWKVGQEIVDGEVIEFERSIRVPTGVRLKIYPEVISAELWQRANSALETRTSGRGRKGVGFANLFQGLARCDCCGGPMNMRSSRNQRGRLYQYYRCDTHFRRSAVRCWNDHVYDYALFEAKILEVFAAKALKPETTPSAKVAVLRQQIAELRAEVESLGQQATWMQSLLQEAAKRGKSQTEADVVKMSALLNFVGQRNERLAEIAKLEKQLAAETAAEPVGDHIDRVKQMIAQLPEMTEAERYALRAKINAGLKTVLHKITFDDEGYARVYWPGEKRDPNKPGVVTHRVWEMMHRRGGWMFDQKSIDEQLQYEQQRKEARRLDAYPLRMIPTR